MLQTCTYRDFDYLVRSVEGAQLSYASSAVIDDIIRVGQHWGNAVGDSGKLDRLRTIRHIEDLFFVASQELKS